jgi:hypothetical protein
MALDALTEIDGAVIALLSSLAYRDPGPDSPGEKVRASITALRTALSAPATTRGGWFIDAGQSNIGALWQQVEAGTDGAVWLSSALSAVPPLPDDTIAAALADPACTRLREWAAIGPVQRAAVQSFADRLAAAPSVPAGWVDAVMEQAQVFASAWSLVGSPFDDGDALGTANEEKEALRAMLAAAPHPAGGVE